MSKKNEYGKVMFNGKKKDMHLLIKNDKGSNSVFSLSPFRISYQLISYPQFKKEEQIKWCDTHSQMVHKFKGSYKMLHTRSNSFYNNK